jgi:hypothetical protein
VSCDSIVHYIVVHLQCMRQIDVSRVGRTAAKTEASHGRGHWFDPSTATIPNLRLTRALDNEFDRTFGPPGKIVSWEQLRRRLGWPSHLEPEFESLVVPWELTEQVRA